MSSEEADRKVVEASRQLLIGDIAGALTNLGRVLAASPDHLGALNLLARLKSQVGDIVGAVVTLDSVIRLVPSAAPVQFNRALLLLELGRLEEAATGFSASIRLRAGHGPSWLHHANTLERLGRLEGALSSYETALRLLPRDVGATAGTGVCLAGLGRHADALRAFDRVLELAPSNVDTYFNQARCLQALDRHDEALAAAERGLSIKPDDVGALIHRGISLLALSRLDEALSQFDAVLARWPMAEAAANRGLTLLALARGAEARAAYDYAISLAQDLSEQQRASLRYHRGLISLYMHRLRDGWPDYENRWAAKLVDPPALDGGEPVWRGERLEGTLRIWREQPLGDEVLLSRLVPLARARAGKVIFECSPRLAPLFTRSFPNVDVRAQGEVEKRADAQISVASLGAVLNVDAGDLAGGEPFLKADPVTTASVRARYKALADGRPIVGLAWFSNNRNIGHQKSAPLSEWGALLSLPYFFVNLQYGPAAAEAIPAEKRFACTIHSDPDIDQMKDLDGFASQVAAMDQIISVSNTTVHFAGSLGIPCTVLVAPARGRLWYWGFERHSTPWYASVQVCRRELGQSWYEHVAMAAESFRRTSALPNAPR